jgi:hypothetical protein
LVGSMTSALLYKKNAIRSLQSFQKSNRVLGRRLELRRGCRRREPARGAASAGERSPRTRLRQDDGLLAEEVAVAGVLCPTRRGGPHVAAAVRARLIGGGGARVTHRRRPLRLGRRREAAGGGRCGRRRPYTATAMQLGTVRMAWEGRREKKDEK